MYTQMQQAAETTRAAGKALRQAGEMFTKQANAMNEALKLANPFLEMAFPPKRDSGARGLKAATYL
jgi:hypothetical protein